MTAALQLGLARLRRRPGQSATQALVLALAVALLGAMILFIGHSLRTMTISATHSVPLDLQGPVNDYGQARQLAGEIAKQPDVAQASAVATAPFAGVVHRGGAGVTTAGAGAILAVPPHYLHRIDTFRILRGGLRPGEIVLDQQLAATLRARVGDTVRLRPGAHSPPRAFKVGGVALITAPDVLFQPLNPVVGPAPAQPPANIAIMPIETFAHTIGGQLPSLGSANAGSAAVPGTLSGVQWQVQAQIDRASLGGTPSEAFKRAGQIRSSLERSFPGKIQFVDNLSEGLETASGDALYAEALFIMLAVPGALLALGLAYLAALGTVERDRRELALLRARGASRRQLLGMAAAESSLIGLLAGLLGAGLSFAAVALLIEGSVGLNASRAITVIVVSIVLAIAGGFAARLGTGLRSLSETVAAGRRNVQSRKASLWRRLYLDFVALAISGLIYWLTASTGFSAVVNPDSNPTLSLSIYMFFAPTLLWIGATLLLVRLRGGLFSSVAGRLRGGEQHPRRRTFLLASASRRGPAINRGLVFVGLLLAFGVSLGVFAATYDQQAGVDAQLTLGADVTATAPPGVTAKNGLVKRIEAVPGVTATSPVDHSYAYVGPDLQDTFGIDPATIGAATTLRDSYFIGGGAQTMLSRLKSTPDGIIVSKETITDYSLKVGDLLRLRVLDHASGRFRTVPFHVVGTVQEFPSAPRDSFMVANLSYLQKADRAGGPNVVFASTSEDPAAVANRVAEATKGFGVSVKDIRQQAVQTVSSITTVDMTGISRLEQAFAIVLAAAAMWLFVSLVVSERRHEFATMAALGASLRDIGAFVRSEAVAVLGAALVLAAGLGLLLAEMLIAMLQHVFDPPPDHLAIPWGFLGLLVAAAVVGALLAALVAARSLRRLPLGSILREE
ncbi:MAG: putative transport system permease protein [Solirubrobacterales bacterium]|jgi:putative ABC transport system permease protein|nr:putative transport system permease protein [Solirubrobacterales bacterium]